MTQPAPTTAPGLSSAFRALADPTRRAILDLLREAPRTTGHIAGHFEMTRFGVMKHLRVLVESGLVIVRREGRERWNHLNPMPIHQIAQRWMRPFEAASAERLVRLARVAEGLQEEREMTAATDKRFRTLDIHHQLAIRAPADAVWTALTGQIAAWWPATFYVGKAPVRFALEVRVGGRVYEDWGDGEGALWGTVTTVRARELLQWVADLPADYGGPGRSLTSFELAPDADRTTLTFRDTLYGELSTELESQLTSGWEFLLKDCFVPYAEDGKQPERPESVVRTQSRHDDMTP